jgi:hypothetical protein
MKLDFEKDEVGKAPKGFSFAVTGQGKAGVWVVRKDDQAHSNVLVQTDPDPTDYRFPVAIYNDFSAKDVDLSFSSKPSPVKAIKVLASSGGIGTRTTTTSRGAMRSRATARSTRSSTAGASRS